MKASLAIDIYPDIPMNNPGGENSILANAGVICRFAKAMNPGFWSPPPKEVQVLQALSRRLHSLGKMRTQEMNRKEAEHEKVIKTSIGNVVKTLEAEMEKVKKKIKQLLICHEHLKKKHDLLVSIPGVGEQTAHLILAEVRIWISSRV